MKIAILGAGAFGRALGDVLEQNGHKIQFYDPRILKISLSEALADCKLALVAVPSFAIAHVLPHLSKDLPLIIATKGILSTDIFSPFTDVEAISGPGFAVDIVAGKQTHLTATSKPTAKLFTTEYLSFDLTDDFKGVLMCGALKNVYAILAGLYDLQRDSSQTKQFLKDVSEEMQALLWANGARPDTVKLACGIGDLELTCGFPSRNYEFGHTLRTHKFSEPDKTVEGLTALRKIKRGEIIIPENLRYLNEIIERSESWG